MLATDFDIIKVLKILMNIFDDLDKHMKTVLSLEGKYKEDLKILENVDMSNSETLLVLQEKFSKEQMTLLIQIFYQFLEFESKFRPIMDDRVKESQDVQKLIKGICSNLHKVLGD